MALVKLLAPILPHTCEEAWEHIPFRDPATSPTACTWRRLPDYDAEVLALAEDLRAGQSPTRDLPRPTQLEGGPAWVWQTLWTCAAEGLVQAGGPAQRGREELPGRRGGLQGRRRQGQRWPR